ncbi:MAG: hypothetical protein J5953_15765 [Prevotella sp.]|nr:hypothetical protein [Prevotella sp.]
MMVIEWTSVVLAVITMVSGWFSWWLDRRRHRQEVEGLKADNRQKEMNLSKDYVSEFRTFIAEPLQREVGELRQEVKELKHAIELVSDCPHRDGCPVREQLQRQQAGDA